MKIETENLENRQVKLTVEVEPEALETARHRAARKIAQRSKIPGFRPGKAPYSVVLRFYGEAAVTEEAVEFLIDNIYPKVIEEAGIEPYGPGKLEKIVSLEPTILEFVIPLDASVVLGDYHSIRFPYTPPEVTEEEIQQTLTDIQARQAILEPADHPAQEGDVVYYHVAGEINEADEPTVFLDESDASSIILAEDVTDKSEWPYGGFSRNLIGLSSGDEKTIETTLPEDYGDENLRDKPVVITVIVKEIKSRILPAIDDELAQGLGEYADLPTLREDIRTALQRQKSDLYNREYDEQVIHALVEGSSFEYPPQMLDAEIDSVVKNFERRLANMNMDLDLYLKTRAMDLNAFREEAKPMAEEHLKETLALYEVGHAENIQIETEELEQETARTMSSLSQALSKKESRRLNDESVLRNIMTNVAADMYNEKVLTRLRDIARGKADEELPTAAEAPAEAVAESGDSDNNLAESDLAAEPTEAISADLAGSADLSESVDLSAVETAENEAGDTAAADNT